jgi:rhodanese-related sulfurtransferase
MRSAESLLAGARERLARLDPFEALAAQRTGALIVDTRCEDDRRALGVIPGSVHAPLSVLIWRLDPSSPYRDQGMADPERQVIVVCAHGFSSSLGAAMLRDLGYARATDLIGGFQAWQEAGLPIAPLESVKEASPS